MGRPNQKQEEISPITGSAKPLKNVTLKQVLPGCGG
jgi:hypothetical protein